MRERLLRNNDHHNAEVAQLVVENKQLKICLKECAGALEQALNLLQAKCDGITVAVPPVLKEVLSRISSINSFINPPDAARNALMPDPLSYQTTSVNTTSTNNLTFPGDSPAPAYYYGRASMESNRAIESRIRSAEDLGLFDAMITKRSRVENALNNTLSPNSAYSTSNATELSSGQMTASDHQVQQQQQQQFMNTMEEAAAADVEAHRDGTGTSAMQALAYAASMFSSNLRGKLKDRMN